MAAESEQAALVRRGEASRHFRVEPNAFSYGELWEINKFTFPISAALKLLGIRSPTLILAPLSSSLGFLRWEDLPDHARQQLQVVVDALSPRGFSRILVFSEDWRGVGLASISTAFLDEDRTTVVLASYTCLQQAQDGRRWAEHVDLKFHSEMQDGRLLVTSSSKHPLRGPPEYDAVLLAKLPPAEVAQTHAARVAEVRAGGQPYRNAAPLIAVERDELEAKILAWSKREAEFQAERGVYVPASAKDLARIENPSPPAKRGEPAATLAIWFVVIALCLLIANLW